MTLVEVAEGTAAPIAERAIAWGQEPDISARSALVTILGDTIAPLGGTAWLAHLITLAEPFGFNERLVRTSMFRLAAEGWVDNERIGRQSRYSLTPHGERETAAAEERIYHLGDRVWDGSWTLVFLARGPATVGPPPDDDPARLLRWRGFARMADSVHARPNDVTAETRELLDRLGLDPPPAVANARFDGAGEAPVDGAPFRLDSGLAEAEDAYRRFVDRYRWADPADGTGTRLGTDTGANAADLDPVEAFALRTMVIHDLRRARLRDPDLPVAVLPDDWIGLRAIGLAARIHAAVAAEAWSWVAEVTGLEPDLTAPPLSLRFTPSPTATPTPAGDAP
jgi:phenylacetic acid degradation operon negative regulatory protein